MVLNKRILREFLENKIKYLGLVLLVTISSMTSVGFADSIDSIFDTVDAYFINTSKLTHTRREYIFEMVDLLEQSGSNL